MLWTSRCIAIVCFTLCAATVAQSTSTTQSPAPSLTVVTRLVLVDVVVRDAAGHPIQGLKANDFVLTEEKHPQALRSFEEHSPARPVTSPKALELPPGTFTNYTPVPPDGTLNVLLIDALNTPNADQTYVRKQLLKYVQHADPTKRTAIFLLGSHLLLLQSFTSDPAILRNVVEYQLSARSPAQQNVSQGESLSQALSEVNGAAETAAAISQAEAEAKAAQTESRIGYTLDAFNDLAHYLSAFPGRKNVVWFSGSFPIDLAPDPDIKESSRTVHINDAEFRETLSLLSRARVAVYPVDARGLAVPMGSLDVATPNTGSFTSQTLTQGIVQSAQTAGEERGTMYSMARDTGGEAILDTNDLAAAAAQALAERSDYYTLAYYPTTTPPFSTYRDIHVSLSNPVNGAQLSYRRGYLTDAPRKTDASQPNTDKQSDLRREATALYARAAMTRGGPAPQEILFKARLAVSSEPPQASPAPGNTANAGTDIHGQWQAYDIDMVTPVDAFSLPVGASGKRTGAVEAVVFVYDATGRVLNSQSKSLQLSLTPEQFEKVRKSPLRFHMVVSAPAKQATFLRLGFHDLTDNRFGVIEVPSSAALSAEKAPAKAPVSNSLP